jgi:hypothetical protein
VNEENKEDLKEALSEAFKEACKDVNLRELDWFNYNPIV